MAPKSETAAAVVDFTTGTNLVSETRFNCADFKNDPKKLFELLRLEKTTGKLEIHMHQGGIQRATLSESSPVDVID